MMTMPFLPSLPKDASLLNLFKAFPETSIPLIQFNEALLRGPSPLTEGEREPSSLMQADADAIFAAGWEEAALYYTVAVTALF
jgi:hypothetical protein